MFTNVTIKKILFILLIMGFINYLLFYSFDRSIYAALGKVVANSFLIGLISFIQAWFIWLFNMKKGINFFYKSFLISITIVESLIILAKLAY